MKHELWKDTEGETFCLAGPRGDAARKLLSPQAELTWTIDAPSHFEAMTAYYKFREWGEYTTDQEVGSAALSEGMGRRMKLATSPFKRYL